MKRQRGFTLLELLIALVLLGVLAALAWSILDNFRNAEQRGWKLAARLQTVRSARLWLEDDLLHSSPALIKRTSSAGTQASSVAFRGDSRGFTIQYSPSIDPLPWLEELLMNSTDTSSPSSAPLNSYSRLGLFPVEATYRIQGGTSITKTIRSLAPKNAAAETQLDEPTLTTSDLYRSNDNESSKLSSSSSVSTSTLDNIFRARFRYYNGNQWVSSWAATATQTLPVAIELSFDLDNPDTLSTELESPSNEGSAESLSESINTLPEDEPIAEVSDDVAEAMLQEPRQIRIVVRLPWVTNTNSAKSSTENSADDLPNSSSSATKPLSDISTSEELNQ